MDEPFKKLRKLAVVGLVILLPAVAYLQRWNIYDNYRLNGYNPPAAITALAEETSMSPYATKLFYVNHPSIFNKQDFRARCTGGEKTIVLGCYIAFNGIYLQNITDERLHGILQVTAAHEMLHAAYQRLSASEKQDIGELLDRQASKIDNERIKKTLEEYKADGADLHNEMHSIFGTEVRNLIPELETFYKRYFLDRSKVVAYSERYEAAFTSRKQQVEAYDHQLGQLKKDIDAGNADLERQQAEISRRQAEMERDLAANNIERYNAAVPGFNALVDRYNRQVNRVRALIDEYNAIVKLRNEIALEEGELVKAIDSRPSTVESQ